MSGTNRLFCAVVEIVAKGGADLTFHLYGGHQTAFVENQKIP